MEQKTPQGGTKEFLVLGLFAVILTVCVLLNVSLVFALIAGYALFFVYALTKGLKPKEILKVSLTGLLTIKIILFTFVLIGILTGLWRASGTIASIVDYSSALINPQLMILLTFLLNCMVSMLTGTAFGTSATMGSICMTMALTMGVNPLYTGGAVLAGAYFGDRCSPVSTSALLVSELTGTNIFDNVKGMLKSAVIPFVLSCLLYYLVGKSTVGTGMTGAGPLDTFRQQFHLGWIPLIPAAVVLILAVCKVNVRISMFFSILAAAVIGILYQGMSIPEIMNCAFFGFKAKAAEIAALLNGGGIVSMINVSLIVCISSLYSGIFEATGLLLPAKSIVDRAAQKVSAFTVILPVSTVIGMIACNQTLTIILTDQLCRHLEKEGRKTAMHLANSAVIVSPLIPWSIAGTVSLSSCNAPAGARFFAFFLYLLPLCTLVLCRKKRTAVS